MHVPVVGGAVALVWCRTAREQVSRTAALDATLKGVFPRKLQDARVAGALDHAEGR
jgi:hypothetical protein